MEELELMYYNAGRYGTDIDTERMKELSFTIIENSDMDSEDLSEITIRAFEDGESDNVNLNDY